MDSFYSTLAQVTTTMLAILAAAIAAYGVFLRQRATEFDDRIAERRVEIRAKLLQMRAQWPWTLSLYLPPEFNDSYRSRSNSKGGIELLNQAAADLIFHNKPLLQAEEELKARDRFDGPIDGRIYIWTLTQLVRVVTGGPPDTRLKSVEAWPDAAEGPGFDQWRKSFEQTRQPIEFLSVVANNMIQDFDQFLAQAPPGIRPNLPPGHPAAVVNQLFAQIQATRLEVSSIEKDEALRRPYLLSKNIHIGWITILGSLGFLLGTVLPLLLGLWEFRVNGVAGTSMLAAVLSLTLGAVILFVSDVSSPSKAQGADQYSEVRWLRPMLKTLELNDQKTSHFGGVDLDLFYEGQVSPELKAHPTEIAKSLSNYISATQRYDKLSETLNRRILELAFVDETIKQFYEQPMEFRGGLTIFVTDILSAEKLNDAKRYMTDAPNSDLAIVIDFPRWTFEQHLRNPKLVEDRARLISRLMGLGTTVRGSAEWTELENARNASKDVSDLFKAQLRRIVKE